MSENHPGRRRWNCVSSNLSIGLASVFVVAVSGVALVADGPAPGRPGLGAGWSLRGAMGQTELPRPLRSGTQIVPRRA